MTKKTLSLIWAIFLIFLPFVIAYFGGSGFVHQWYVLPLLLLNGGVQIFAHFMRIIKSHE